MGTRMFSGRRRTLIAAALAGAGTPAWAGIVAAGTEHPVARAGDTIIVSGRVVDASGKPVQGAIVQVRASTDLATSDGDGRFVLTTRAPAKARVSCHVASEGRSPLLSNLDLRRDAVLQDENGAWRTSLTFSLA